MYQNRFNSVDLLIAQLVPITGSGTDPLVLSSIAGIVAVEAVSAFELAIKDILGEFAAKKHKVFGAFVLSTYGRLNGRITYKDIKDIVRSYGEKYHRRFLEKIDAKTSMVMAREQVDLVRTYDNLITGRHQFVHAGVFTMTIQEAIKNYTIGKELLAVLDETMKR